MAQKTGKVTERTFYPAILRILSEKGCTGVSEVQYNSEPDIEFSFKDTHWILSVKIGESPQTIRDAVVQYNRHKQDSGIRNGMLLFLNESVRHTHAGEAAVRNALLNQPVSCLVDAGPVQQDYGNISFPELFDKVLDEILRLLYAGQSSHWPVSRVVSVLKSQIEEVMGVLSLREIDIMEIVTNKELLSDLGDLEEGKADEVARFLAAYIIMSQILFLRFFVSANPDLLIDTTDISRFKIKNAFKKILEINYKPIYEIDVLDSVSDKFIQDIFYLIWGLQVEKIRYEIPGRLFHALMPFEIRKMMAAFYTRPTAAELLAKLSIDSSEVKVFDPACGSGTILTAAYKAKKNKFEAEGKTGNPHKRFCEEELFGADIMPFGVHLTAANLAVMDVKETIERTQIIGCDSLDLQQGIVHIDGSLQLPLFRKAHTAKKSSGEEYEIDLEPVDVVLMNPPFTKVERGIKALVNMNRYIDLVGGEVGLWGHFIQLAQSFLLEDGKFGAVLPINILRGRESAKVRDFIFREWEPIYIIKPTLNYAFSEWAEYRDIILIARKTKPTREAKIKFCLVKTDLNSLDVQEIEALSEDIRNLDHKRSDEIDIDTHSINEVLTRPQNMMWFIGVGNFEWRDRLLDFVSPFLKELGYISKDKTKTGFRPGKNVTKFLFLTRGDVESRIEKAFLRFTSKDEKAREITTRSKLGVTYLIEKASLTASLRTPVGINTMDISGKHDYIAHKKYRELSRVFKAAGIKKGTEEIKWDKLENQLARVHAHTVITRRINPFSPDTVFPAFYSEAGICPSDQVNVLLEDDKKKAKAVCAVLNSVVFLAQFFMSKEETTGRWIDLRLYDLEDFAFYPKTDQIKALNQVFDRYKDIEFPSLHEQFDSGFSDRYKELCERIKSEETKPTLWSAFDEPIKPFSARLNYDLEICSALSVKKKKKELIAIYEVLANEMMIIKRLTSD